MDDDIACVDQHPVTLRHAFGAREAEAVFLEAAHDVIGDGGDMAA